MSAELDRREVLKLIALLSASSALPVLHRIGQGPLEAANPQNILIVVFDAFSGKNLSLNGYGRSTTPHLEKLAQRAVVYHNHYSGAPFTTPGTASLLTGTLPWTHRALRFDASVARPYDIQNIFGAFSGYNQLAYSHNMLADTLLRQFRDMMQGYLPNEKFFFNRDWATVLFPNDRRPVEIVQGQMTRGENRSSNSFFFGRYLSKIQQEEWREAREEYQKLFPRGIPALGVKRYYILEPAIDWLIENLPQVDKPFLGYFHLLPPHDPYKTRKEFIDAFLDDGLDVPEKPNHLFTRKIPFDKLMETRRLYDEYILYVDAEFNRLYTGLQNAGLLDNTWILFTSDHGELMERGYIGHLDPHLHQPVVRIPLVVFEPGREQRLDVHTATSAIDILPTLLQVTGQSPAPWAEGLVLPPYGAPVPNDRSVYVLQALENRKYKPLAEATTALVKDGYKLMHYSGYEKLGGQLYYELYDLNNDPEELTNLYDPNLPLFKELNAELLAKLDEVNEPYQ